MTSLRLDDRDLLSRLVGIDTTSSRSNREAIDFLCDYLDRPGLRMHRVPAGVGKENLVVEAGPDRGDGSGLTLSGHLDCVPPGEGWTGEAFRLEERDGRLFARGSCDMKGFDALAVNAMAEAAEGSLSAPLAMVLTCDEEVGGIGAAALVDAWPRDHVLPRATIIGEPTMLQVVRMHKGHLKFRVTRGGEAAHSGSPHLGRNATDSLGSVLSVLESLSGEFRETRSGTSDFFQDVPNPVLCVVGVEAGAAWNVVPEHCEIRCSLRVLPDQDPVAVLGDIEHRITAAVPGDDCWEVSCFNDNPPLCTADEADIHRELQAVMGQDKSIGVSFCSDGGHLSKLGLECVLWGPGSIEQAHMPDEYLAVEQFATGRRLLDSVINSRCGGAS